MNEVVKIETITVNGTKIALVNSDKVCISDGQTALDLMMSVNYETDSRSIVTNKDAFAKEFFVLSTGIAGEVLQKFINYHFKLAIVGDFSAYTSKPLKEFMYESNRGEDIFFVSSKQEAIDRLSSV